jgi:hypothetical protein
MIGSVVPSAQFSGPSSSQSPYVLVAARLQAAGLIRYTHGRVTVRNRKGLEKASCECYAIIHAQFDRLRQ